MSFALVKRLITYQHCTLINARFALLSNLIYLPVMCDTQVPASQSQARILVT